MSGEEKVSGVVPIAVVARETRHKIAFLQRKSFVEQREVYAVAKRFFTAYAGQERELTTRELREALHHVYVNTSVRDRAEALLEKLSLVEFTDTRFGQAELKLLLQDLEEIVKSLVIERRRRIPFLTRVANWLFRRQPTLVKETVIAEYPVLEALGPGVVELFSLIEVLYAALDKGRVRKAVKVYKQVMSRYDELGPRGQQECYHTVHEAYEAIVKATTE